MSKSGDGDPAQLEAVTAALDAFTGDFFGRLGSVINVDQWLEYWAWCAAIGNYDGYPFTSTTCSSTPIPPKRSRLVFAPWGTDESWDLSEADVATDPKRPFTPDYVWYYQEYYAGVMPDYGEYVRAKLGL